MSTNEWITDRLPTLAEWYVYAKNGAIVPAHEICTGEPWKPIPNCEPYVKPKRYRVDCHYSGEWRVTDTHSVVPGLDNVFPTREAAERIAAIYEEVMP